MTSPTPPAEPSYADRTYRSGAALVCGVLLILLIGWIGGDAVFRGAGWAPWIALATLLTLIPLVVAFTLRPAVYANEERIRIRNPFRTIELPWADVSHFRASYTSELFTEGGAKYQLWAVPVSLRQRKKADRQAGRAARSGAADAREPDLATADQTMKEMRRLSEQAALRTDQTTTTASVRWAYELLAPSAVGAVLLVVLLAIS